MTSVVSLSDIFEKFHEEMSLFKRGENAVQSGHIASSTYDGSLKILKGTVYASMKNKKYSVEIHFLEDGKIQRGTCECPRGQHLCHHMAALLIHANKNVSKTDSVCQWNKPSTSAEDEMRSIPKIYPSEDYDPCRDVTEEDKKFFLEEIKSFDRFSGFFWLLQEEPAPRPKPTYSIQELFMEHQTIPNILKNAKIDRETIERVATETVGQRDNPLWLQLRNGRLTSSNFGKILSCIEKNKFPKYIFDQIFGHKNLEHVKSIQWGISREATAVKEFEEATELKVTPTGLWLHENGVLGASPDGLVGNDGVLEVKCPFSMKDFSDQEIYENRKYCFDDAGALKKDHPYYHQIQGQLHICGRSKGYLMIYTLKTLLIILVDIKEEWRECIPRLSKFYEEQYLPKLLSL